MSQMLSAKAVVKLLREKGDPKYVKGVSRFFKTGPGDYGFGDVFLGLRMPEIRSILKDTFNDVDDIVAMELIKDEHHEVRMYAALWLLKSYEKAQTQDTKDAVYQLYCGHFKFINNWDLVDVSAPGVTGKHLAAYDDEEKALNVMLTWCKCEHLWTKRIAVLSTFPFIRSQRFRPILTIVNVLLENGEQHDLMHKASGWMLREVGKRDKEALSNFLEKHASTMPRVMLRYAIEKFSKSERRVFLDASNDKGGKQPVRNQRQRKR